MPIAPISRATRPRGRTDAYLARLSQHAGTPGSARHQCARSHRQGALVQRRGHHDREGRRRPPQHARTGSNRMWCSTNWANREPAVARRPTRATSLGPIWRRTPYSIRPRDTDRLAAGRPRLPARTRSHLQQLDERGGRQFPLARSHQHRAGRRNRTAGSGRVWNSHGISGGCGHEALARSHGAGLFYCFGSKLTPARRPRLWCRRVLG